MTHFYVNSVLFYGNSVRKVLYLLHKTTRNNTFIFVFIFIFERIENEFWGDH